jgi:exodeoxyribonuclease VII large subunit
MSHPLTDDLTSRVLRVDEYLEVVNTLLAPLTVSVEGEITDLKILPQWVFFALKDAETGALLRCGLHSGVYRRLGVNVEEGMTVRVTGYGKIALKSGNFGFWVSKIEPVGEGALRRAYELLVKKLDTEGLFARKRDLPSCISHIGVISSRNGVVLQDLMKNLRPLGIRIDFLHAGVEGADSAPQILRAVEHFSRVKGGPEVLVLIRGGGSLESLQGFNNEAVARALFASPVPVLVGIGHDVDAPIASMVADKSASTPTAVAHLINESWSPLTERMPRVAERIATSFRSRLRGVEHQAELAFRGVQHAIERIVSRFYRYEEAIRTARNRLPLQIARIRERKALYTRRMLAALQTRLSDAVRSVDGYHRLITASDPARILARGYGIVRGPNGAVVRSIKDIAEGDMLETRLADGTVHSIVQKKDINVQ